MKSKRKEPSWNPFTWHRGGTTIRIIADGPDEEAAVKGLVDLVDSGFAEGAR